MVAVALSRPRPRGVSVFVLTTSILLLACSILYFLFQAESPGVIQNISDPHGESGPAGGTKPRLFLSGDNTFKIAIFSDLHYGEEEHGWGIDQDVKSGRVMRSVLRDETPDLVVINGDLITGENTFKDNASDYVHQIVAPMVEANAPWASTYGNHDSKFNLSRELTYAAETTYPLSYTTWADHSLPGITNYFLLLHSKPLGRPVAILWFFDSCGGATYQEGSAIDQDDIPNWVSDKTADWFLSTAGQLESKHGHLPSLAFVHIPPHVFLATQRAGLRPSSFPGVNDDVPVAIQGEGVEDQKFVDALLSRPLLHSVYVGHDHGNSWCALWPSGQKKDEGASGLSARTSPFLCFGKHTGYGGYGDWNRGSRVVHLNFVDNDGDGDFDDPHEFLVDTWVRMENSNVVTRVSLNETYGIDQYPTNNGEPGS
ncbi:Metallo-dependent phosphatase [Thozetella sp. PMI_491]|nr:Metallo-dependent phosphatase [Thozetella sp. PMI_491]